MNSSSPANDSASLLVGGQGDPDVVTSRSHRYERLLQLSRDLLFSLAGDGRVQSLSPSFEAMTGWSPAEWLGKPFLSLIHHDDHDRLIDALRAVHESRPVCGIELRILTKDAQSRYADVSLLMDHEAGHEPMIVGIARDTTEPKRTAETLLQREAQLQQAQKMEAIGRLAGGIAHDFNNLLTIITGYSQLLLTRLRSEDGIRGDVEEIRKAAVRAASLTQQLLAFSRRQVMTPKIVSANAVIEALEAMLQRLIGEDVHLTTALEPDVPCIKADPCQIEQVIMNLVINARDAMPHGGRLTIATTQVHVTDPVDGVDGPVPPGRYVVLSVEDTGCGMDAITRARMFEPFFTTKAHGKGTGLGLATVYGIVKQSAGQVVVTSTPGVGTQFHVYLPAVDRTAASQEPEKRSGVVPSGSETVLLVEDEPTVRILVRDTLRLFGYTVLEARHGFEAQVIGAHRAGPIDLLITDVVMPQMNGRDLAERLRHLHPTMKVLYMSGYTQSAVSAHGVVTDHGAFLQKPFSPECLARTVRHVLDGSV